MKHIIFVLFLKFLATLEAKWLEEPELGITLEQRLGMITRLTHECRRLRNESASACEGHSSRDFGAFLGVLHSMLGKGSPVSGTDVKSWDRHCAAQEQLKDTRTHSVCEAVSFLMVPFPLTPEAQRAKALRGPAFRPDAAVHLMELKLVAATVYTQYRFEKSPTMQSSCRFKVPIHVLGRGIRDIYKYGLGEKVNLLTQFLDTMPTSEDTRTVLLFVDGADTIFQKDSKEIIQRFHATGSNIVFSAEHSCYPMKFWPWGLNLETHDLTWRPCDSGSCSNSRYICDHLFPVGHPADRANRWLNSGAFIGYLGAIRAMLKEIKNIPVDMLAQWPGYDQGLYTHLYLSQRHGIHVDSNSSLFLSYGLVRNPDETPPDLGRTKRLIRRSHAVYSHDQLDPHSDSVGPLWANSKALRKENADQALAVVPSVIHFNADGKKVLNSVRKEIIEWSRNHISEVLCEQYITIH